MPGELLDLFGIVPPALQPFFVSGPVAGFGCAYIYYLFRDKRSAAEREDEKWDAERTKQLRGELDTKTARLAEVEERASTMRASLESQIDRMRREHERELQLLQRDANRGWNLARDWCGIAHRMWHSLANEMQKVPEPYRGRMPDALGYLEDRPGLSPDLIPQQYIGPSDGSTDVVVSKSPK